MRVVHIVPQLFSRDRGVLGGAERYALELARAMAKRVKTTLVAFGPERHGYRDGDLDVQVVTPWLHVRRQAHNPFSLAVVPELLRADVIHVHQRHILMASLAGLVGRLSQRPVFVTDLGGGGWDISAYVPTDGLFAGHLHISEYSREVAGHVAQKRARVILGGVDRDKFRPGPGGQGVLFVGRLLPHKGVDVLLGALPDGARLRVAGTTLSTRYRELLEATARGKNVQFLEAVSEADLVRLYSEADVVVLPSVYVDCYGNRTRVPELLGQTLLEGMASARPTVCTQVASMPEVVVDGETGLVVPPNDPEALRHALERLLADGRLRESMGHAGRRRVETVFSWENTVDRCLSAYRDLGLVG